MTIHITEAIDGRLIETETQEETDALIELSLSLSIDNLDGSKRAKRRARRAWLRFEYLLGRQLPKTAGITREEIVGE